MNKVKKEEFKRRHELRRGLSPDQISALDVSDFKSAMVGRLARNIHVERFPEEYDEYGDSLCDAHQRSMGKNPMAAEYIERVNSRRLMLGVRPLAANGRPASNESMEICHQEACEKMEMLYARVEEILLSRWRPLSMAESSLNKSVYASHLGRVVALAIGHLSGDSVLGYLRRVSLELKGDSDCYGYDAQTSVMIMAVVQEVLNSAGEP